MYSPLTGENKFERIFMRYEWGKLTLAELENMLFAIYNLECSIRQPLTNVPCKDEWNCELCSAETKDEGQLTGMMPSLRIYRGRSTIRILKVAEKLQQKQWKKG